MNWEFSICDLEKVKQSWESNKESIEFWGKYSLKRRKIKLKEKLEKLIEYLDNLLKDEEELENFLKELNSGTYRFSGGSIVYDLNKYYNKVRIAMNFPYENQFKDLLASKLVANKINEFLKCKNKNLKPRNAIVKQMLNRLKSMDEIQVIRGDFVSYTQNIPRESLMKVLRKFCIPENILELIHSYLEAGNNISSKLSIYNIHSFFKKIEMERDYLNDADFKALINQDGLLPGTPLSNTLAHIFLLEFDTKLESYLEKTLGKDGYFYSRYNDDFVIIYPKGTLDRGIIKSIISKLLSKYYMQTVVPEREDIVRIRYRESEFEFLGYLISKQGKKLKVSVRYKTLKKFIYKYLAEYRLSKSKKRYQIIRHIVSKAVYLNMWNLSFIHVNDTKLLDDLFIRFILPDLYYMVGVYIYGENLKAYKLKKLKTKVKRIQPYFKPVIIHRQLLKLLFESKFKEDEDFMENFKERITNLEKCITCELLKNP